MYPTVRGTPLPAVNEAAAAAAGGTGPAEFPGNILEAHGEGRIPGRVGPDTAIQHSPSSGKQTLAYVMSHLCGRCN